MQVMASSFWKQVVCGHIAHHLHRLVDHASHSLQVHCESFDGAI